MSLSPLIDELSRLGVTLRVDGAQLAINAPKGAITAELRDRLRHHKSELLRWLEQRAGDAEQRLPTVVHDAGGEGRPFALSDLQSAFHIGQMEFMDHHVRPHFYTEIEWPKLHVARYEKAWHRSLSRHLGSLSVLTPDVQLAPLAEIPPLEFRVVDLRGEHDEAVQKHLLSTRERMMRSILPLDRWPWLDWEITLYGTDQARIHFNGNSFFSDGPGTQALFEWVQRFYDRPELDAPPLEITFRDCALALERLAESERGRAARKYWLDRVPDLPPPPPLPRVADANPRSRSRLERRKLVVDARTWSAFKGNARTIGLTPSNAVAALYAELVGAWSNSRHFIINNMVTRRFPMHPQIRGVLGNFASLYPLEIDLRGGATFADRAGRIQQQLLHDLDHLSWGGMQVLQALNRHLQAEPGRASCPFVIGSGLFMASLDPDQFSCLETPQALLDHQYWELADGRYFAVWDLIEEFFPAGLVDAMWRAYSDGIHELSADPDAWRRRRVVMLPAEQASRRAAVNATEAPRPSGLLHACLRQQAELRPEHPAIVTPRATLSYAELHRRACRIGRALRERGALPNQLVAVVAEKGAPQIAAVLGVLASGAAYVPIDPGLPGERLRHLLANAQVTFAVTDRASLALAAWPPGVERLCVDGDGADLEGVSDAPLEDVQRPEDLAYVIYTSGSTGEPKGVMIDHRGALNTVVDVNRRFGVGPRDRVFGISALNFDLSVYDIFGTLAAGATLVLPEAEASHAPLRWVEQLEREGVTLWSSVPALMQLLVEALPPSRSLPALRLALLSGDWIPVTLPDRIRQAAPAAQVISLGGATEASIWSIAYPIGAVDPRWPSIPYGRPLANQTFHVLGEDWQPCPDWVEGELYIGGAGTALGYWRDPDKTERSFVTHPHTRERLYRTGDFGRWLPTGDIEFLGRRDLQVKIQGHRIELGEIEAALLSHPSVANAVALLRKGEAGQGRRVVAYVVAAAAAASPPTPAVLQSFLAERLPSYMVPTAIVTLPALPLTSNGKVDRGALTKLAAAAEPSAVTTSRELTPPRDDAELAITRIWEQVLGPRRIGVLDDFFEIGGNSFAAVRVLAKVDEQFGQMIPLAALLEGRTIASLAERLRSSARATSWSPLVRVRADGEEPPYFFVHPAGGNVICYHELAQRLGRAFYGLQAAGLDGREPPCDEVPAMAARYVEALRQVRPSGPHHLGGWSSGGTIAFEMARQLESRGERVQELVLIDSPAPLQAAPVDDARLLLWFLEDLNEGFPVVRFSASDLQAIPPAERLAHLIDQAGGLRSGLTARALAPVLAVFEATIRAGRAYRPQPIHPDLTIVVKARDQVVSEFADHPGRDDAAWGWGPLVRGDLRGVGVPGTHHSLLVKPHLDALVQALQQAIPPRGIARDPTT
jgi:amino acid adenylation domain-containing protein